MPLNPWSTDVDDGSIDDSVSPSPTRGDLKMGQRGGISGSVLTITKQPSASPLEQYNSDPKVASALTNMFMSAVPPSAPPPTTAPTITSSAHFRTLTSHITTLASTLPFTWFTSRGSHTFLNPTTPNLGRPKTVAPDYMEYSNDGEWGMIDFQSWFFELSSRFLVSSISDYEEFTTIIYQTFTKYPPTYPPATPSTILPINLLPTSSIALKKTHLPGSTPPSPLKPLTPTTFQITSRPPSRSLSPPSSPNLILRELSSTLDGRTPLRAPSPPMSYVDDSDILPPGQLTLKSLMGPKPIDPTLEYTKGLNTRSGIGSTKNLLHMEGKVWPPPSIKLLIDKNSNCRVDKFACISYDTINRITESPSIVGVIRSALASKEDPIEITKPLTADKAVIVDVGDGTKSLEDYKFTKNGGSTVTDDTIEKIIKLGAKRNLRCQAEYEASRSGFKGVKTLKNFLEMADEADKTKLETGGERLVSKGQTMLRVNKKRVNDRMRLMKFRSGVGGRKNVQEYLKDKHEKSLKILKGATDEAYTAYLSQTASLESDEDHHFVEDREEEKKHDINNNTLDEGSVTGSVTSQVSQPVKPDVYISRTPKSNKHRQGSPIHRGNPENNVYMSPTSPMAIEDRNGYDAVRSLTGGGIIKTSKRGGGEELGLGPSLWVRREKRIMCDHEMCRGKFGKVEEAVFWSQVSGHCFCTYCWEMIDSHQPHGVAVNYGEKKQQTNEAAHEIERAKLARRDSILNAQLQDYQRDNSVHKEEELLDRLHDLHNPAKQTVEYLRAKANTKSADVYREVEGVPEGASLINLHTKDRAYLASLVPQMTDTRVKLGRSYCSDGSLKPPSLHVGARVTVSYMNDSTRRGIVGGRKSFSKQSLTAHEASRRRKQLKREEEKQRRMTSIEDAAGGRKTSTNRFTIKSAAGRGKDPLVLSATSMSATGLKAGSSYAPPDFCVPMLGISNDVEFDDEDCVVDESLLKSRRGGKGKVVKVVHGVPVYFKDELAAMDASERRKMKRTNSNLKMMK